jgi:hypothetical protein
LLEELAADDPAVASYRARYADLVAAINAAVPADIRYTVSDYASLDADCRMLDVAQPDETTMAPYASAYFARWQVLLDTDLPPLIELYETHLYTPWRERMVKGSPSAEWVMTVEWLDGDITGNFEHGDYLGWRYPLFAPDGRLYVASAVVMADAEKVGLHLTYGPATSKKKLVVDIQDLDLDLVDPSLFDLTTFLSLGPDRLIAASSDMWGEERSLVLIDFQRGPEGWTHRVTRPLPDLSPAQTRLRIRHDGALLLEVYQFGTENTEAHWQSYVLDGDTLTVGEMTELPDSPYLWFSDIPGMATVLLDTENPSVLVTKDGTPLRIAGNGLQGFKEMGAPLDVEFTAPTMAIGLEGRILVLDYHAFFKQYVIREIALLK